MTEPAPNVHPTPPERSAEAPRPRLSGAAPSDNGRGLTLRRRAPQNVRERVTRTVVHVIGLVAADVLALGAVVALYLAVRDHLLLGAGLAQFARDLVPTGAIRLGEFTIALVVGLAVTGNYSWGDLRREPARLLAGAALGIGLVFWTLLWARSPAVVLGQFAAVTGVVWVALFADRVLVDLILQTFAPRSITAPRTLLVGYPTDCADLHRRRVFGWDRDYTYVGFVDPSVPPAPPALGGVFELPDLLDRHAVHWVVIASSLSDDRFRTVTDACAAAGCKLFAAPRWLAVTELEPRVIWRRGHGLLELTPRAKLPLAEALVHAPRGLYVRVGKRALDVAGALLGLALGAVPAFLAAVAMRLESRGPVFILQPRVGRGGRIFEMIKLRTMVADAERRGEARWAAAEDPRVTPVGRWVRRLRLDEVPQFVNVLLGHMSLVGPRPERPELHDRIVTQYPDFAVRVAVKPGITGLAQIYNGYADSVDSSRRKLEYDRRYIANLSLGLDLALLVKTVRVVLTGRGSR